MINIGVLYLTSPSQEIAGRSVDLERLLAAVKIDRSGGGSGLQSHLSLSYHEFVAVMLVHNKLVIY